MNNVLSKEFTFGSLLRFAIPNVMMMITLSMYVIVDGMFISHFLGTTALSAANMVYPAICFEMALAIMIATGGNAIIARKLGEQREKEARRNFSFLVLVEGLIGLAISVFGNLFITQIVTFLGASSTQFPLCVSYARILFTFAPAFFLQTAFQTFFVTAGKPTLGLFVTVFAGVVNIVLDYLFLVPLQMGIAGAALATGIGYCIPAAVGVIFFTVQKTNPLHFVRPETNWHVLLRTCTNGSSEMVTNLANAATTFLFNAAFLRYYGEDGVASITIILYFQYLFTALYFGYSNGIAPIISFKYGTGDRRQLKKLFWHSIIFLSMSAVCANLLIHWTIGPAVSIFAPAGSAVYRITVAGFVMYSPAFLIMGFSIFASALFTAFSDGKTSAILSFSRTFLFIIGAILIFPHVFGKIGIWTAVPVAEGLGLLTAITSLIAKRKRYGYF